jgi:MATE family multidrug resistance protein
MALAGIVFLLVPRAILRIYTTNQLIIAAGVPLFAIAAAFQLFDGIQTLATGALRGTGNTHSPMIANLVGYWVIGLPLGYWLCFSLGWGAVGLWVGLCCALMLIGTALLAVWAQTIRPPA